MNKFKRVALTLGLAVLAGLAQAQPQGYPNKPVKAIVTLQAGAGTDILARYMMDALSRATGKNFYIENHPGAGGNIGMSIGEKSPPDGYTLQFSGLGSQIINPLVYTNPGWDPKNFDGVLMVARLPFLIAVNNDLPAKNLQELIALSKAKPGTLNISVTSTTSRIAFELLKRTSDISLFPITYNSPNPASVDVISGRVSVIIETVSALLPQIDNRKLKAIAITTQKTSSLMPNVKSISEQGVPGFGEFVGWTSLLVPKGTSTEIINWLNVELNKILVRPETIKRLAELGSEPGSGTPQELAVYFASERAKWSPIIREAGIKVN